MIAIFSIQSIVLDRAEVELQEGQYYQRFEHQSCYSRNNILSANLDISQICIDLKSEKNTECNQLPFGVYFDLTFSNFPEKLIRSAITDFEYNTTSKVCFSCPDIGGDTACDFIQDTEAIVVQIQSLTRKTTIVIGQIFISHAEYAQCFDSTQSELFWSQNTAKLVRQRTFQCPDSGNLFDKFIFELTQIDGKLMSFEINGQDIDGNNVYDVDEVNGKIEIVIYSDFSAYYANSYNSLEAFFYSKIGDVTVVRETQISLIQSEELEVMYENAIFTIWANKFDIVADSLPNSYDLDQLYTQDISKIQLRYQVFNKITGQTIENLFFWSESFTFQNIRRGIQCDDRMDGGSCSALLRLLQQYDIFTVDILVHYYFYNSRDEMYLYSSNLITQVENICWNSIEAYYLKGEVCGAFQANPYSKQCQYLTAQDTEFTIQIDDLVLVTRLNYSTEVTRVCIKSNSTRLQSLFKQNSTVSFKFLSDGRELVVEAMKSFNSDYSQLTNRLFIYGIVLGSLLVVLFIIYIIKYKVGIKLRQKKKSKQTDQEDL